MCYLDDKQRFFVGVYLLNKPHTNVYFLNTCLMSGSVDTDPFPSRNTQSNQKLKHIKVICFTPVHGRMCQVLKKNTGSIISQTASRGEPRLGRVCTTPKRSLEIQRKVMGKEVN